MSNLKNIDFVFLSMFVVSFFLPVLSDSENTLFGYHFFVLQFFDFPFNSGFMEYTNYFLKSFLCIGVLLLFFNRWLMFNRYLVLLFSIAFLYSATSFLFIDNYSSNFSFGYWFWLISILGLGIYCNVLAFKKRKPLPK